MSQLVFPTLPGLAWGVTRTPQWNTVVKTTASGREFRAALYSNPRWQYSLVYDVLRADTAYQEVQQLIGLFNRVYGSFDTFLYSDPDDSSVTSQQIGVGNASTVAFQLVRTYGSFVEPVYDVNAITGVYVNGVLKTPVTDYTVSSTGVITFVTAPGAGQPVTWTGTYYWRCRFLADTTEFSQFLKYLWEAKKIEFITVKP